jgi:hypothetical protein
MFNNKFGYKADFSYNSFTNGRFKSFDTKYYRADLQLLQTWKNREFRNLDNTVGF